MRTLMASSSQCSSTTFLFHPFPRSRLASALPTLRLPRYHLFPRFVAPPKPPLPFRSSILASLQACSRRGCDSSLAAFADPGTPVSGPDDVGGGGAGSGGQGFGPGGGGGGHRENGDGNPEDGDGKKMGGGGMSMSQKITLAYATLVGVGGLMGYVKGGSQKSLAAGGLSALLLYFVYTQLPVRPAVASSLGLGLSTALLVVMGSRFKKSGKIFPAGVVSLVSFVMVGGYFHGILRSLHA